MTAQVRPLQICIVLANATGFYARTKPTCVKVNLDDAIGDGCPEVIHA